MRWIVAALVVASPAQVAQPADEFFKGKPIRFVLGAAPGQDYDVWARFIWPASAAPHARQPDLHRAEHAGRGHMRAANWLYNVAPRDGTVWGSVSRNIPNAGLQGSPACSSIRSSSTGSAARS